MEWLGHIVCAWRGCFEIRLASKPPPRKSIQTHVPHVYVLVLSHIISRVIMFCRTVKLELCVDTCKALLSCTLWLHFLGQKAHGPVTETTSPWLWLALGQGDIRQGEKKKSITLSLPPYNTKMNRNWKTTSKVRLIQEHLQYADVFFCTLCLLNCLWLRASVMKLYVLVERAASLFQLGPGRSLLFRFCKIFFPPNTRPYE